MRGLILSSFLIVGYAAGAEEVDGFWSQIIGSSNSGLRIVIDRSPDHKQTLRVYDREDGPPKYTFLASTGREQFELPTSPLRSPYCSFTPMGNSFIPQRLEPLHISRTWEDAEMPNSIFFQNRNNPTCNNKDKKSCVSTVSGIAIHATRTEEGKAHIGQRSSGGCIRLKEADSKILFDLIENKYKTNIKTRNSLGQMTQKADYSNVSIEIIDSRKPEEIKKLEKECSDTRKFWMSNCKPLQEAWANDCRQVFEKENPAFRQCKAMIAKDPTGANPETPRSCKPSSELGGCLKRFHQERDQCRSKINEWKKTQDNFIKIHDNNAPLGLGQVTSAPLPPPRPVELGGKPQQNTTLRPPADIPLPPKRPEAKASETPAKAAKPSPKAKASTHDVWDNG